MGESSVTRMRFLDRGVESPPGAARALPNGELIVVDGKTMTVQGRVDVGPMPITVRGSADASRAWVSNLGNGKVSVVDLAEVRVIAELHNNVGRGYGGTHGLTFVPPGKAPRAGGQAEAGSVNEQILIVGAGPVGLWLAAELQLAGVPSSHCRAGQLSAV